MLNQSKKQKSSKKSLLVAGVLLSATLVAVGGCGTSTTSSASPASSSAAASTTSSSTQSGSAQQSQGQTSQRPAANPALRVVMEIRRLESNQQYALTSDQKAKLKPILQSLISTTNPTQDVLQQKADAITAIFTTQQTTFLKTRPTRPQGTKPNGSNSPNGANSPSTSNGSTGRSGAKRSGQNFNPQTIYQDVLNSLN